MTIQRFDCVGDMPDAEHGEFVKFEDHQAELAALREEMMAHLKIRDRELEVAAEHTDDMQQRLTAAEQRNSELVELLRTVQGWIPKKGYEFANQQWWAVEAAIKPTESGASE